MIRKTFHPPVPADITDSAHPSLDGVERQSGKAVAATRLARGWHRENWWPEK